jgi:hypothetical protein
MKKLLYLSIVFALLAVVVIDAVAQGELTISNPQRIGNSACFDFIDSQGKITFKSARVAVWDRQDNPSFQTLYDWGASLTGTLAEPDGKGYKDGTICIPEVLSDHCNKPGEMWIFFKLRDTSTKPSRTTTRLDWRATCP